MNGPTPYFPLRAKLILAGSNHFLIYTGKVISDLSQSLYLTG